MTTETVLRRAFLDANLSPDMLDAPSLPKLRPHLELGIRMFVALDRQESLRRDLAAVTSTAGSSAAQASHPGALASAQTVAVRVEADISQARLVARTMCVDLPVRALTTQKIATIVSELARNIVSYTPGGTIELSVEQGSRRSFRIRALDEGRGISNLDEIFAGRYKSSTGLGKGILGVKRLADAFDIRTGDSGTRIDVEVTL